MKKIQTISLALLLLVIALAITVTSTNGQTPTQTMTDKARNAPCADPWINIAFQQLGYGTPGGFSNIGDCNTALYNNGSWNNYDDLKRYVKASQEAMTNSGYEFRLVKFSNDPSKIGVLLTQGAKAVAAGGANVVAAGGLNVIAPGGGNVVAAGGLNLQQISASAFYNFSIAQVTAINSRTVFSADKKVFKLNGGTNAIVYTVK